MFTWCRNSGPKPVPVEDLMVLLADPATLIWVDIPRCDIRATVTLSETFGFHDIAIRDCVAQPHQKAARLRRPTSSPCCTRPRPARRGTCPTT